MVANDVLQTLLSASLWFVSRDAPSVSSEYRVPVPGTIYLHHLDLLCCLVLLVTSCCSPSCAGASGARAHCTSVARPLCLPVFLAMHKSLIVGLLGLGRHRLRAGNCSRTLCQSSSASSGQAACQEAATAAPPAASASAPRQLLSPPHGRRYLPAAVLSQLAPQALPAAAASVVALQRQGCVSITVQCSPTSAGTQILVSMITCVQF